MIQLLAPTKIDMSFLQIVRDGKRRRSLSVLFCRFYEALQYQLQIN